jgi:GGDEF domain-containing protein
LGLHRHCDQIKAQGGELYEQLFRTHRRLVRLRTQLEKIQLKAGGPPPKQLVDSRAFREKFRNILQNTRLQRENVSLILCRIQNIGDLEERLGGEMLLRILKHVIASYCGLLRKNDLITRLDRDVLAVLLANVPLAGARALAERLLATLQGLRFRYQGQPYQVTGQFGIAGCRMHAPSDHHRKALASTRPLAGPAGRAHRGGIPPELLDDLLHLDPRCQPMKITSTLNFGRPTLNRNRKRSLCVQRSAFDVGCSASRLPLRLCAFVVKLPVGSMTSPSTARSRG